MSLVSPPTGRSGRAPWARNRAPRSTLSRERTTERRGAQCSVRKDRSPLQGRSRRSTTSTRCSRNVAISVHRRSRPRERSVVCERAVSQREPPEAGRRVSLSTPRARVKDHGLWSEAPKGPQASRADSARKCRRAPEARRRLTRASNVVRHLIAGALVHPEGRTSREARFFPDERKRQPTVTRVPAQEKRQPFFFLRLSSRRTFDEIRAPG